MIWYFGGKFNPFTRGHYEVLSSVCHHIKDGYSKEWEKGDKIVIGITKLTDNDGIEGHALCSSEEYRWDMVVRGISPIYNDESLDFINAESIEIVIQTNPSTYEFLKERFPKEQVMIVLGEDEKKLLEQSVNWDEAKDGKPVWKHAKALMNEYKFLVVQRDSVISSTAVRALFKRDPFVQYPTVRAFITKPVFNYIKDFHLYHQHGDECDARREENIFLNNYDITKFPRPSATVDIIAIRGNKILLVRRKGHPYKGYWALPGGFFDVMDDNNLEETAERELEEETSVHYQFKPSDQFRVYSDNGIDPRGRIIDTVFAIKLDETDSYAKAGDDAAAVEWFDIDDLPRLAFHHSKAINDYLCHVKAMEAENDD